MFDLNNVASHELSGYPDGTLLKAILGYEGRVNFIHNLKEQARTRGLSGKQLVVAARILNEEEAHAGVDEHAASTDFSKIPQWLSETFERGVAFPKFHFNVDGAEIVLRYKTRGQYAGMVDVVSKEKAFNERFNAMAPAIWYGRIDLNGSLNASQRMSRAIEEVIARIADDPETVAVEYGRMTNRCSFCGRDLNNEVSVELGFGPVCARKYNLEHNKSVVRQRSVNIQPIRSSSLARMAGFSVSLLPRGTRSAITKSATGRSGSGDTHSSAKHSMASVLLETLFATLTEIREMMIRVI